MKIVNAMQVLQNQSLWRITFKKSHGSANHLAKDLKMFRFATPWFVRMYFIKVLLKFHLELGERLAKLFRVKVLWCTPHDQTKAATKIILDVTFFEAVRLKCNQLNIAAIIN